jgi:hypothetical protein
MPKPPGPLVIETLADPLGDQHRGHERRQAAVSRSETGRRSTLASLLGRYFWAATGGLMSLGFDWLTRHRMISSRSPLFGLIGFVLAGVAGAAAGSGTEGNRWHLHNAILPISISGRPARAKDDFKRRAASLTGCPRFTPRSPSQSRRGRP